MLWLSSGHILSSGPYRAYISVAAHIERPISSRIYWRADMTWYDLVASIWRSIDLILYVMRTIWSYMSEFYMLWVRYNYVRDVIDGQILHVMGGICMVIWPNYICYEWCMVIYGLIIYVMSKIWLYMVKYICYEWDIVIYGRIIYEICWNMAEYCEIWVRYGEIWPNTMRKERNMVTYGKILWDMSEISWDIPEYREIWLNMTKYRQMWLRPDMAKYDDRWSNTVRYVWDMSWYG